jgi:hypothetical protein
LDPSGWASLFLFQLAANGTNYAGLQFIVGLNSQGVHETPGGFHPVPEQTFPTNWAHVVFSATFGASPSVSLSVDGVPWLTNEPITPPVLSNPYFSVGIVQIDGPTAGATAVRMDNVTLAITE